MTHSSPANAAPPSGLAERIRLYLEDAPSSGGHSDAAGANCWELLQEAMEELLRIPAQQAASPASAVWDFAKAILHGDDEHRAWLLEAALAFQVGKPLPAPRGSGIRAQQMPELDPSAKWLDAALRHLARELVADPKTPWIGERDPRLHICWTAADRLLGAAQCVPNAWCQPMDQGKHTARTFLLYFEDADKGIATYRDESEARRAFEQATLTWNCYLFGALPLTSPESQP